MPASVMINAVETIVGHMCFVNRYSTLAETIANVPLESNVITTVIHSHASS